MGKNTREITLEELKQAEEYEKVTLYIDKNKQLRKELNAVGQTILKVY